MPSHHQQAGFVPHASGGCVAPTLFDLGAPQPQSCTLNPAPCTLHPAPCTLNPNNPAPSTPTLHPKFENRTPTRCRARLPLELHIPGELRDALADPKGGLRERHGALRGCRRKNLRELQLLRGRAGPERQRLSLSPTLTLPNSHSLTLSQVTHSPALTLTLSHSLSPSPSLSLFLSHSLSPSLPPSLSLISGLLRATRGPRRGGLQPDDQHFFGCGHLSHLQRQQQVRHSQHLPTQGPSWGYFKSQFLTGLSSFGDCSPQNGSKTVPKSQIRPLGYPHIGPFVEPGTKKENRGTSNLEPQKTDPAP